MIDSHIHLSHRYYHQTFPYIDLAEDGCFLSSGTLEALIEEMKSRGICGCIEPAIDVESNGKLLKLSEKYRGFLYPAVGNHPARCIRSSFRDFQRVRDFSRNDRVIAIGETGLDYHHRRQEQHRIRQKIWFQWQINLAHRLGLPLILHIRDADDDAVRILRRNKRKLHGGVVHCFGRGAKTARIYTEEFGLCLGIGGTVLMREEISAPLCEAVSAVPLEYLLLETDGPYVKPARPEEITGKRWTKARNTSLILPAVARKIADIQHVSAEHVMKVTEENTKRVFRLASDPEVCLGRETGNDEH